MKSEPYIYKITDLINNKVIYIGQHNGNNQYYEGSSLILKKYKKKYGTKSYKNRFLKEILEYCCDINDLNDKEIFYIKQYDTYKNGYNLTEGGNSNLAKNTVLGKSFPEKNQKLKGQKRSEETIELMKERKIGYIPSPLCHENRLLKFQKSILQYDLEGNFIREWGSEKEAFVTLKLSNYGGISACCLKKSKTSFGFIWKFKTNNFSEKIEIEKRKLYKKRITSHKSKPVEINGIIYRSILQAGRELNLTIWKISKFVKENQLYV